MVGWMSLYVMENPTKGAIVWLSRKRQGLKPLWIS